MSKLLQVILDFWWCTRSRHSRSWLWSCHSSLVKSQFFVAHLELKQLLESVVSLTFQLWRLRYFSDQEEDPLDSVLLLIDSSKQLTSILHVCDFSEVDLANWHMRVLQVHEQLVDY